MTDPDGETARRYRDPPIEHRFRKGVSGNPKGRPRKTRVLVGTKIGGQLGVGFEDPIKSLAIKEAYRMISVKEGNKVERIPIIQAILRKLAVAAANGDTRAQHHYVNLVSSAEAERRAAEMEVLKTAIEYKEYWGGVLAERARTGATGQEPVPHPDDVIIDYQTGEVRFEGPVLEEQHAAQNSLREKWPECQQRLWLLEEQIKSDPENSELRKEKAELEKITDWLMKDAGRRAMRDALRRPPGKSKKSKKD